jgi:hypothetical protein
MIPLLNPATRLAYTPVPVNLSQIGRAIWNNWSDGELTGRSCTWGRASVGSNRAEGKIFSLDWKDFLDCPSKCN